MTPPLETLSQYEAEVPQNSQEVFLTLWDFLDYIEDFLPWEDSERYNLKYSIDTEITHLRNSFENPKPSIRKESIIFENNILSGTFDNDVDFIIIITNNILTDSFDIILHRLSRQEILMQREQEVQELAYYFEQHLDAMRQIFRANVESSQRWGEFIMDRWALNDQDIFTAEMADNDTQELVWKTLLQVQEIARDRYIELIQFLGEYPVSALSPSLREMIQTQIDTYTRMIMWVGIEYNWGAGHFRRKTQEEVSFWITYWVENCDSAEELFANYRRWHQDMSQNWWSANALTQRQSYPLVAQILSRATYLRLQHLSSSMSQDEKTQAFAHFIYMLRWGRWAGQTTVWNIINHPITEMTLSNMPITGQSIRQLYQLRDWERWSIDDDFSTENDLHDTAFANEVMHDYFLSHNIIGRLEAEQGLWFQVEDSEVWEKNCSQILLEAGNTLQRAWIENDSIFPLINQVLWWIDNTRLNGKLYQDLNIEDKFRISSLVRFTRDIEHLLFQISSNEERGLFFTEYRENGWRPPELTIEYILHRYESTIVPRTVRAFWWFIGQNFNWNNRLDPQEIDILTPWERNMLGLWADINGYGGIFEFADSTMGWIQTGTELAAMIAVTVWVTMATGWVAAYWGAALWATRVSQAGHAFLGSPLLQWASMWFMSVPMSRYMHPEWHDDLRERLIDLWSDYSVWILTWLLWWAISARFWRQGAHLRNTTLNAGDITLLWFGTEVIRNMMVYNYLHGQEEFLWQDIHRDEQNIGESMLLTENYISP